MMTSTVIAVVGGSTVGKTKFACSLTNAIDNCVLICGDQYQTIGGFPIATGSSDSAHMTNRRLYSIQKPYEDPPDSNLYGIWLKEELDKHEGPAVIDSLSIEYFPSIPALDRKAILLGLKSGKNQLSMMNARLARALTNGLIDEVRDGVKRWGRETWLVNNSTVISTVLKYLEGDIEDLSCLMITEALAGSLQKEAKLLAIPSIVWVTEHEEEHLISDTIDRGFRYK